MEVSFSQTEIENLNRAREALGRGLSPGASATVKGLTLTSLALVATHMIAMSRSLRAIAVTSSCIMAAGTATHLGLNFGIKAHSKRRYDQLADQAAKQLEITGNREIFVQFATPELVGGLTSKDEDLKFFANYSKLKGELEKLESDCAKALGDGDLWKAKELIRLIKIKIARPSTEIYGSYCSEITVESLPQLRKEFKQKAKTLHLNIRQALADALREKPWNVETVQQRLKDFDRVQDLGVLDHSAQKIIAYAEQAIKNAKP
jgi:hypothetical protein